eukprot:TRINITY_DN10761_c0_g1_i1.p1 TRINITY_DN10761_c0_g1~~TRINITY_DN10761_c0_g1_i1.p1  ORF type:complete len:856 (+),score=271.38 TRINITY_DN10761_c0_g1_i1:317-2884(+)
MNEPPVKRQRIMVEQNEKVQTVAAMGFSEADAKRALDHCDGDISKAVAWLTAGNSTPVGGGGEDELQKAIAASLSTGGQPGQGQGEDEQLQQVIMASMSDKPAIPDYLDITYSPVDMRKIEKDLPVGLRNVGNTCYGNTYLQLFYNILPLRWLIMSLECGEGASFMKAVQETFVRLQLANKKFVDPREVLQGMTDGEGNTYKIGDQEDVTEFNGRFLNSIEQALKDDKEKRDTLLELVEGEYKESYKVAEEEKSSNADTFRSVVLAVDPKSQTLHEMIENHTKHELIEDYQYEVPSPSGTEIKTSTAEKSVWFTRLPNILNFQLQRASYQDGHITKNNQIVQCPLVLNMDRYMHVNNKESMVIRKEVSVVKHDLDTSKEKLKGLQNVEGTGKSLAEVVRIVRERLHKQSEINTLDNFTQVQQMFDQWELQEKRAVSTEQEKVLKAEREVSSAYDGMPKTVSTYKLSGILMHDGTQAESGHYWACLYNPETQAWYKYNDINVRKVSEEELQTYMGIIQPEVPSISTAYCFVYVNEEVLAGEVRREIPLQRCLLDVVEKENKEFEETLVAWDRDLEKVKDGLKKISADADDTTGGTLEMPKLDPKIHSKFAFVRQKYGQKDDVYKLAPVAQAYSNCFGNDIISDWQNKTHCARAEQVARDADVYNTLYPAKNVWSTVRTQHTNYGKSCVWYHTVLKVLTDESTLDTLEKFNKTQTCVWDWVKEQKKLDKDYRDEKRYSSVLLEFLVRWVTLTAKSNQMFTCSVITDPVGYMGRLAMNLPVAVGTKFQEYLLNTVSQGLNDILKAMLPRQSILDEYQKGKNPPQGNQEIVHVVPTLPDDILDCERKLKISPATLEMLS